MSEMLADALGGTPDEAGALAREVDRKTGSNPLLVQQFVQHIHDGGLLSYSAGRWVYDLRAVSTEPIPDSAVGLMTAKLERLDARSREILQFASCVGGEFDAALLARLNCGDESELRETLYALSDAGMIVPSPRGFRFAHQRLRDSVQRQIADDDRGRLHYAIGEWLLSHVERETGAPTDVERFDIADHLCRGRMYVPEDRRMEVIAIEASAGKTALASGAAAHAWTYSSCAHELFRQDDWSTRRALGFELYLVASDAAFQTGRLDRALELLDTLAGRTTTPRESAEVVARRIQVLALRLPPIEVTRYALDALRGLGVRWPVHPSRWQTRLALWHTRRRLRQRARGPLFRPPEALPERLVAVLAIAHASGAIRSRVDYMSITLSACFSLRESLRHGVVGTPSYLLAAYAAQVRLYLGDGVEAARATELAREWVTLAPNPVYGLRAEFVIYIQLGPWTMPRRAALAHVDHLIERLRETGDVEWAYYSAFLRAVFLALGGEPIVSVLERLAALVEAVERAGHRYPDPTRSLEVLRLLAAGDPSKLDLASELAASQAWLEQNPGSASPYVNALWLMVLCTCGHEKLAFDLSEAFLDRLWRLSAGPHIADYIFWRGFAAGVLAQTTPGRAGARVRRVLARATRRLKHWMQHGPDYVHMEMLLRAEQAHLANDVMRADKLYQQAARAARRQEFWHHAALAHERRARMLAAARRSSAATPAYLEAIELYRTWGVEWKSRALEAELSPARK
jgi:hypothetical protein